MSKDETPLTREVAREIFERRRQAWLANDAEAYMALWVDDMVIELPGREPILRRRNSTCFIGDHRFGSLEQASLCARRRHAVALLEHVTDAPRTLESDTKRIAF